MAVARGIRTDYLDAMPRRTKYEPPHASAAVTLKALLAEAGREPLEEKQFDLLRPSYSSGGKDDVRVFYAGDSGLLGRPCVSIVGTRNVSDLGYRRASRLARELAAKGFVTVSGLARGVDTAALTGAMDVGGKVVAVIGTPLTKAYPAENAELQEDIWRSHLLVSPFAPGDAIFKSNFPKRNRVMAAVSDATVIIEASDTSGTLHQAAECQKLGRWLFIARSVVDNPALSWPNKFLSSDKASKCVTLDSVDDIVSRIPAR